MVRKLIGMILCVSILLLAGLPAWGSPGRMVLVNGKLHQILRNNDNHLSYARGHADQDWSFHKDSDLNLPALTTPWPCRTYIPTYQAGGALGGKPVETFAAEGLAVFDNKIWVAYTADADCKNPSAGMAAYVSAFDLTTTDDYPDGHWTLFPVPGDPDAPPVQYNKVAIGSAHTDTPAKGWGSGAAITVFNNQLYVFTDNGVYTSGDGKGWTYHDAPFATNAQHEPLDAVTLNTPDGQRILIVYGYISGQHYYYDHLDAVDWNGQFGSASQAHNFNGTNDSGLYDPSGHWRGRVSLTVGTKAKGNAGADEDLAAGALAPAVQLFGQSGEQFTTSDHNPARHAEYVYTSIADGWGTWTWDSTRVKYFDHVNPSLMVYPWSEFLCDSDNVDRQAMRQYIVLLGGFKWGLGDSPFAFGSDFLVPQHERNTACTFVDADGTTKNVPPPPGIENNTEDKANYRTLVGVVLGSPPFSDNGTEDALQISALSGVSLTQDSTKTVETTSEMENTLSVSVGHKVTAGLFDVINVSKSFDASYKHTWAKESGSTSKVTISLSDSYGTATELSGALGRIGWAIFSAPHVYVQDWTVYGYDYKYNGSSGGTALSFSPGIDCSIPSAACLDLQTVSSKGTPDYKPVYFDLKNPGADPLFAGMKSFNYSDIYKNQESLDFWSAPKDPETGEAYDWQYDERWETRAGDGGTTYYHCKSGDNSCNTITQILASSGSQRFSTYKLESETMTGSGHTNEVGVTAGASMGGELSLKGFSAGAENNISVGYDGKFSWNTKTTTGTGTTIVASQLTPGGCPTSDPDCFKAISVRPYWLHPVAGAAAAGKVPWIPTAYSSQMPWCLTWKITSACKTSDPDCNLLGAANEFSGAALPPANAFGRIVNGTGGGEGGEPYSHYVVQGGRMVWVNDEGGEQRIPMSADDFVPAKGVTIEVAGGSWSSSGNGSWKRHGDTWMFQTNPGAQPRVTLSLDFGSATYDLAIQKVDLNGRVLAGVTNARLVLGVNERYKFYTLLNHDIDISWQWSKPPADDATTHVTSFQGRYDSATQSGKMSIAGTLPADLPAFGDVEINVNDHPYVARLITMDGFQQAFETGGVFRYAKEGLIMVIDFGKKTWSATFNQRAFHRLLSPRWGTVRARVIVGGVPWLTEDNAIVDYSANLKLRR